MFSGSPKWAALRAGDTRGVWSHECVTCTRRGTSVRQARLSQSQTEGRAEWRTSARWGSKQGDDIAVTRWMCSAAHNWRGESHLKVVLHEVEREDGAPLIVPRVVEDCEIKVRDPSSEPALPRAFAEVENQDRRVGEVLVQLPADLTRAQRIACCGQVRTAACDTHHQPQGFEDDY